MPEPKFNQNTGIHLIINTVMPRWAPGTQDNPDPRLRCQFSEQRIFGQQHQLLPCIPHLLAWLLLSFSSSPEHSGSQFGTHVNERGRKKETVYS